MHYCAYKLTTSRKTVSQTTLVWPGNRYPRSRASSWSSAFCNSLSNTLRHNHRDHTFTRKKKQSLLGHERRIARIDRSPVQKWRRNIEVLACSGQTKKARNLFIFGIGYLGLGLATQLAKSGWFVSGTCRDAAKQRELQSQGYQTFLFDTDNLSLGLGKQGLAALRNATHILVTISPASAREFCPVMWMIGQNFKEVSQTVCWIGYLSSTSVYGDHGGGWVTERCELRAKSGNGLARRSSESSWLRFGQATQLPIHVFRLAGIYGPGRSALDISTTGGKRSGKRYTSRCHVHDICQILIASMVSPKPGEIYNVADDDPSSRETVMDYACNHFKLVKPRQEDQQQRKVTRDEKRVCNKKIKEQLGVTLLFPSYREGLEAISHGETTPFAHKLSI